MFLLIFLALALVTVPLTGGRLGALADLHFRHLWAIAASLAVQIVIISIAPDWPEGVVRAAHLLSYALAGFFLWMNRKVAGLWLIALGWGLNFLVISVNGGVMPTSRAVAEAAPRDVPVTEFVNSRVLESPKLTFLGDAFALPDWFPLRNVFSIGDAFIVVGLIIVIHQVCKTVPARFVTAKLRSG